MQVSKYLFIATILSAVLFACKKNITQSTVYDNVIYNQAPLAIYENAAQKTKIKSDLQYLSIMYSNLYNKSISPNTLTEISTLTSSIGDKQLASQMILAKFLADSNNIIIPSASIMRADVKRFVLNTYLRFYLRNPTPYEQYYLANYINQNPGLKPAVIYTGFILSNEYHYY